MREAQITARSSYFVSTKVFLLQTFLRCHGLTLDVDRLNPFRVSVVSHASHGWPDSFDSRTLQRYFGPDLPSQTLILVDYGRAGERRATAVRIEGQDRISIDFASITPVSLGIADPLRSVAARVFLANAVLNASPVETMVSEAKAEAPKPLAKPWTTASLMTYLRESQAAAGSEVPFQDWVRTTSRAPTAEGHAEAVALLRARTYEQLKEDPQTLIDLLRAQQVAEGHDAPFADWVQATAWMPSAKGHMKAVELLSMLPIEDLRRQEIDREDEALSAPAL